MSSLERLIQLNKHAERLMPACYGLYADLSSDAAKKLMKKGDKKLQVSDEWKRKLERIYTVAKHVRDWCDNAKRDLNEFCKQRQNLGIVSSYGVTIQVIKLFLAFVRISLLIADTPKWSEAIDIYQALNPSNDSMIKMVSLYISERSSSKKYWKIITDSLMGTKVTIGAILLSMSDIIPRMLLPADAFPWHMLRLLDAPEPYLPSDRFISDPYLVMMHMTDICDCVSCYALVFKDILTTDENFLKTFTPIYSSVYSHTLVFHVYGQREKSAVQLPTELGNWRAPSDESKLGVDDAPVRERLADSIHEFTTACRLDGKLVIGMHALAFSLLGLGSFHLANVFRMMVHRPATKPKDKDVAEDSASYLLFHYMGLLKLVCEYLEEIRRFLLYNFREYDSYYLNTLVLTFQSTLNEEAKAKISLLMDALRLVDIAEFDQGKDFDLYPCLAVAGSVLVTYSRTDVLQKAGQLGDFLQLLAGVYFRLSLYQDPWDVLLGFTHVHQFWEYTAPLEGFVERPSNDSHYAVSALSLMHYWSLDVPAISEIRELSSQIVTASVRITNAISRILSSWIRQLSEQASGAKAVSATVSQLLENICLTLMDVKDVGTIGIPGDFATPADQLRASMQSELSYSFMSQVLCPAQMWRRLRQYRSFALVISSVSNLNFRDVICITPDLRRNLGYAYCDKYTKIAKEHLMNYFFCRRGCMFIPVMSEKSVVSSYLSLYELEYLAKMIGQTEVQRIGDALADVIGEIVTGLAADMKSMTYNEVWLAPDKAGDSLTKFITGMNRIGITLKLREAILKAGECLPDDDVKLKEIMVRSHIGEAMVASGAGKFLGFLFSVSYWSNFDYRPEWDSAADNSHLWGYVLDSWLDVTPMTGQDDATSFYAGVFQNCVETIQANEKSGRKPGRELLILLDQMVISSHFANYTVLDSIVPYQMIRAVYSRKLRREEDDS